MLCTVDTKLECSPPGEIAMQVSMAFKRACYKGYKIEEALAAYHNQKGAQGPVDQVPVDCKDIKKLDKTSSQPRISLSLPSSLLSLFYCTS